VIIAFKAKKQILRQIFVNQNLAAFRTFLPKIRGVLGFSQSCKPGKPPHEFPQKTASGVSLRKSAKDRSLEAEAGFGIHHAES